MTAERQSKTPVEAGARGRELAAAGRLAEAEPLLAEAAASPAAFADYWLDYVRLLTEARKLTMAIGFIDAHPAPTAWLLRFSFLKDMAEAEQWHIVDAVMRAAGPGSLEQVITGFWHAFALYRQGRHDEAMRLFGQVAAAGQRAWAAGARQSFIPDFLLLGQTLVEPAALAALIGDGGEPAEPAPLSWIGEPAAIPATGPVVVVSCDDRYLVRFADEALAALTASGLGTACHIHLVGGGAEAKEAVGLLRRRFAGLTLGVTVEPEPAADGMVHYASARFLRLPALMAHYAGAELVAVDIDSGLTAAAAALPGLMAEGDVGVYRDLRAMPWLNCRAGVVYLKPTPAARRFAGTLARLLEDRLAASPLWMVDQSALYCAVHDLEGSGGTVIDLAAATGRDIEHVLAPLCGADEKQRLRRDVLMRQPADGVDAR